MVIEITKTSKVNSYCHYAQPASNIHLESIFTFGKQALFSIAPSLEMLWASHTTCSLSALEAGRGFWQAPWSGWTGAQCHGPGMAIDSWCKGDL